MCITLAIDASTPQPSLALLQDECILADRKWTASRSDSGRFIEEIETLLEKQGYAFDDIALYAVGLGPGAFTGLRLSVATLRALAMPSTTPVIGICSADAAAFAIRRQHLKAPVIILGDARRDRLWMMTYPGPKPLPMTPGLQVISIAEAAASFTPSGCIVATADWDRIGSTLEKISPSTATLTRHNHIPIAGDVGILARRRFKRGEAPQAPVDPIYVHPPVSPPSPDRLNRPVQCSMRHRQLTP